MNTHEYSSTFVIKKEHDDYAIKDYIGNIEGTLYIPEGITRISQYAFLKNRCLKIKKIVFPKTLKRIPDCNFEYWDHLEEVVIPEGVKSIAPEAFSGTGIKEIILPSTIEKIGKEAFAFCKNLKKIKTLHLSTSILNTLMSSDYASGYPDLTLDFQLYFGIHENIELSVFFNKYFDSKDLKSKFTINDWIIMYGDYIVGYVGDNTNIRLPDKATGIAKTAFLDNKIIQQITFGKNIKVIGNAAFEGCSSLHTVNLNEALETIYPYAFANSGLREITIPVNVKRVGEGAFSNCDKLKKITIVQKLLGDYYRFSNWDAWWAKGFYGEKKHEYINNC